MDHNATVGGEVNISCFRHPDSGRFPLWTMTIRDRLYMNKLYKDIDDNIENHNFPDTPYTLVVTNLTPLDDGNTYQCVYLLFSDPSLRFCSRNVTVHVYGTYV